MIAGLTLRHGRGDILRAAYEGIGVGIRQILDLLDEKPDRLVAVGGGTEAKLWLQIISDMTGTPQQIPQQTLGAAYGDALLAAIGAGIVPSDTDWTQIVRTVEPNDELRGDYDDVYRRYPELYAATSEIVHDLQRLPA